METERFKLSDIFNGFIIPLILVLLIFVLAIYVNPGGEHAIFGYEGLGGTIAIILTQGFAKMIILGIPLVLGLTWNKWAGGSAGFIMGGMYYVASAGAYSAGSGLNFFGDISMLFYMVNAIIIGYMAGALSGGSSNFFRMLGAGLTAAVTTATIQAFLDYHVSLEAVRWMAQDGWANDPIYSFVLAFVPAIALGVIVPILAKVMSWYGLSARKQY